MSLAIVAIMMECVATSENTSIGMKDVAMKAAGTGVPGRKTTVTIKGAEMMAAEMKVEEVRATEIRGATDR
jgi:hypothetical protein